MVSNQQSNLFYLPPCKVIAAGTDRNNLMQAGLQRTVKERNRSTALQCGTD
jgi:hypothetical protein